MNKTSRDAFGEYKTETVEERKARLNGDVEEAGVKVTRARLAFYVSENELAKAHRVHNAAEAALREADKVLRDAIERAVPKE